MRIRGIPDSGFQRLAQSFPKEKKILHLYDFDGTLFKSPLPPEEYPEEEWWLGEDSLNEPYVPEEPKSDWWNSNIVEEAKRSAKDSDVISVLVTGRQENTFGDRVRNLLEQQELTFDEVHCSPDGVLSKDWKPEMLHELVADYDPTRVEIWDDMSDVIKGFVNILDETGIEYFIHRISEGPHEVETKSAQVENFEFEDGGDVLGNQYNAWIAVFDPVSNNRMGYLNYTIYGSGAEEEYSVQMVEVLPEYRRMGVAEALISELIQKEEISYGDLQWGMVTEEGAGLRDYLDVKHEVA